MTASNNPPLPAATWPVWGHHWAVDLLRHAIAPATESSAAGRGARHAYLFLGAAQIGKSTLANAFAQALLCTDSANQPCGHCRACDLMKRGRHPDFRLVQPTDKDGAIDRSGGTLRAEQAAEIVHDVALRPVEGRYKIVHIQDFHAANLSFANKLLKTLEEPPAPVILLLTALDRSALLPTILSRCQVLELRPLDPATVEEALRNGWGIEAERANLFARLANGRLGWAVQQAQQKGAGEERQTQLETLWRLARSNRIERLAFAEQLGTARNNRQLFGLIELWMVWWRDLMLAKTGCVAACSNIDQQQEIELQSASVSLEEVQGYLKTLRQINDYLHHTVNIRLALDVLLLRMPKIAG